MTNGSHRRDPRAVTGTGRLLGRWDGAVAVFAGIPFARPPVGELRWRPPQPGESWDGDRLATSFGPAPVQPQPRRSAIMYRTNFADRRALVMSEDCLYLNVYTPEPAPNGGLPVMVWLHGGGNRFGYGSQDVHDGARLAARGLVVVTLNYRLGALGFLAHPELSRRDADLGGEGTSGNYAQLDMIAALEWVQANIAGFGGDPARVTLAGNSAGAAHACHLMAAPRARGLFHRVVGQSASGIGRAEAAMTALAQAEQDGARLTGAPATRAGLEALLDRSAVELVADGHYGPIVDGHVLVEDTNAVFADGRQAAVPLLAGWNTDEGSNYAQPAATAALRLWAGTEERRMLYPVDDEHLGESARRYVGETRFAWPVWHWATTHARTSAAAVYGYRFDHQPPLPPGRLAPPPDGIAGYGVYHSAEIPFMWDNLDRLDWAWTESDRALARAMADAWARFVTTADPGRGGLDWPALTDGEPVQAAKVAYFADVPRVGPVDRADALGYFDDQVAASPRR